MRWSSPVPISQAGTPRALDSAQQNSDLPAVGAELDVGDASGLEHRREPVGSAVAFCLRPGGWLQLLLQTAGVSPAAKDHGVDAHLLGHPSHVCPAACEVVGGATLPESGLSGIDAVSS